MTASSIEIVALEWVRVQVTFRLRATAGSSLPAIDALRLARVDGGQASMPPTRIAVDGGELVARFNVMVGPGQRPLEAGRWALTVARADGGRDVVAVAAGSAVDAAGATRSYPLAKSHYDLTADIAVADRVLTFDVARVSTKPPARGLGARVRAVLRPTYYAARRLPRRAAVGLARRTVRRNGRRIVFAAASAGELHSNLQVVHDRMVERGLDRQYELIQLFGARRQASSRMPFGELWRSARTLERADVVLVAGSRQRSAHEVPPGPGSRYIQLWHASGAFKTVGYSRVGKPLALSPYSSLHKNYTQVIVSSEHDVPFYAEAFGLPESRVVPTGIPRMDRFFDEQLREAGRQAAIAAYPLVEGRFTILFAPTFRGPSNQATFDDDLIDWAAFHALAVERDAVVIFKMHPLVRKPLPIPEPLRDRLIDATRTTLDVNDLMFAVDLLITDYSSVVFEYSVLDRPMLFFAYDLDEYIASRDFYEPFEQFVPGRIVRTFDEMLGAIRRDDYEREKVAAFATRHFAHLDGGSTDRVIDQLILGR